MPFGFYRDAGLTVPISTNYRHFSTQGDRVLYFGNPAEGFQLMDATDPGVALMQIEITDSDGPGTDFSADNVAIALTSVGLGTATPGDPLSIGHTLLSGAANAVTVYIRFIGIDSAANGDYFDLGLQVANTIESEV